MTCMNWTLIMLLTLLQFSLPPPLVLLCLSFSPSLSYCFHLSYLTLKDITTSMWVYKWKVAVKLAIQLMYYLVKIGYGPPLGCSSVLFLNQNRCSFPFFLQTVSNNVHTHKEYEGFFYSLKFHIYILWFLIISRLHSHL